MAISTAGSVTPALCSMTAPCAAGGRRQRPARLRQHHEHRRHRDAGRVRPVGLGQSGRPGDRGRRQPHLRACSTTAPCAAGGGKLTAGSATATRTTSATTRRRAGRPGATSEQVARPWRSPRAATTLAPCSTTATVRCWGAGGDGRLGYGNTTTSAMTRRRDRRAGGSRPGEPRWRSAPASCHTCAHPRRRHPALLGRSNSGSLGYANMSTIGDNETPGVTRPVDLGAGGWPRRHGRRRRIPARARQRHRALLGLGDSGRLGYGNTNDHRRRRDAR